MIDKIKKNFFIILGVILIVIALGVGAFIYKDVYVENQKRNEDAQILESYGINDVNKKDKPNIKKDVKSKNGLERSETAVKDGDKLSLTRTLTMKYKSKKPIAYLIVGDNLIREPVGFESYKGEFLWRGLDGKPKRDGSVFMSLANKGFDDNVITLFGHYVDIKTMFSPLVDNTHDKYNRATLIVNDKARHYELIRSGVINEKKLNSVDYTSIEGVKDIVEFNMTDSFDKKVDINDTDRFMILTTCYTYDGSNRKVCVYREIVE